jgi:hypothetical protein
MLNLTKTEMKTIFLTIIVFLNLAGNYLFAQQKVIDSRYKGQETGLRKYIAKNLRYPSKSLENKSIGYSITGITITPEGKIFEISTINSIDESIEKEIFRVLQMTKNKWLKCDTISTNQTFYIPIVYVITTLGETPVFNNPVNDKYNFIQPIILTVEVWKNENLPETNESIATKIGDELKKNEYNEAISYIDESIRRNPFNKELYQLRMSINRKLNKNDLIIKDFQKMQNFIPGVSLDELINKN